MKKDVLENILNDRIIRQESLKDGFVGDVSKITTDSGTVYILKEWRYENFRGELKKEWIALNHLYKNGIRVPKPLKYIENENQEGILMEYIKGDKLLDLMHSRDENKYHVQFAQLMHQIHNLTIEPLRNDTCSKTTTDFCIEHCNWLEDVLQKNNIYQYEDILKWLRDKAFKITNKKMCMLHMDFHPGNVIASDTGLYVLDIVYKIGDYRYDIFWTYNMMRRFGNKDIGDKFVHNYLRFLGKKEFDNTDYFNVLSEFSYLVTCITFPVIESEQVSKEAQEFWDGIIGDSEQYIKEVILEKES